MIVLLQKTLLNIIIMISTFGILIFAIIYSIGRLNSIKREFAKQAEKRNGFFNKGFFSRSNIIFGHDNKDVMVEYIPGGKYSDSYIWFQMSVVFKSEKNIIVYPESFL